METNDTNSIETTHSLSNTTKNQKQNIQMKKLWDNVSYRKRLKIFICTLEPKCLSYPTTSYITLHPLRFLISQHTVWHDRKNIHIHIYFPLSKIKRSRRSLIMKMLNFPMDNKLFSFWAIGIPMVPHCASERKFAQTMQTFNFNSHYKDDILLVNNAWFVVIFTRSTQMI